MGTGAFFIVNPFAIHAAGLNSLIAEQGSDCPVFTWNGADYQILPGGALSRKSNSPGGFSLDSDLQLTVLTAAFGDAEAARAEMLETILLYAGHRYKIRDISIAQGGKQMRLHCDDAAQGL